MPIHEDRCAAEHEGRCAVAHHLDPADGGAELVEAVIADVAGVGVRVFGGAAAPGADALAGVVLCGGMSLADAT